MTRTGIPDGGSDVRSGGQADIRATETADSGAPPRGRPRSEQADRAILEAALELLVTQGLAGMSIEEVASRAGVGKATIYRRWSSKRALALDAFVMEFRQQQPLPDTGTLRGDLRAALRAWVRAVTRTRAGRILAGLIAGSQHDDELATGWRERVLEPQRRQHRIMFERAIARGEIAANTDKEAVLDLLFGAAEHRLLLGHLPLTDRFVKYVTDVIVDGILITGPDGHGEPGPPGGREQTGHRNPRGDRERHGDRRQSAGGSQSADKQAGADKQAPRRSGRAERPEPPDTRGRAGQGERPGSR